MASAAPSTDDIEADAQPDTEFSSENSSAISLPSTVDTRCLQSAQPCSDTDDHEYLDYLDLFDEKLKEDNIHILIVNSEEDIKAAGLFKNYLEKKIVLYIGGLTINPKVKLLDEYRIGSSIEHFDLAFSKTVYVFLYITKKFCNSTWSILQGQVFLKEIMNDEEKKWCIIPVLTKVCESEFCKLPMALRGLRSINYCEEDIDLVCSRTVADLLYSKINLFLERDYNLHQKRLEHFKEKKSNLIQLYNHTKRTHSPKVSSQNEKLKSANGARASEVTTPTTINPVNEAGGDHVCFAENSVPDSTRQIIEDPDIEDLSQTFVKQFI